MSADLEYQSIPRMARMNADRFTDVLAISDGDERITYEQLGQNFLAVARGLVALGIEPGDRVALWAPNSALWIQAALGILASGGWLVPLNTRFRGEEAAVILRRSGAWALFTVGTFLGVDYVQLLRDAAPDLPLLTRVIVVAGHTRCAAMTYRELVAAGTAAAGSDEEVQRRIDALGPSDVADIMFTSGTTGEPKGVMLTHGQSLRGFEMLNHVSLGLHVGDRHLVVPPFFHCFGYKAGWMVSLMFGATVLPVSVFDAPSALELIENERVTVVQGPPTMFHSLLSAPNLPAPQHSALRVAFVGASSVPGELIHRLHRELGFSSVMTGYGLTEASALVALTRKTDSAHMVANWAGRPIPDIEVRIVDDTGQSVSCGTAGEVLVRGYNLMKGYYEDSAATADVIDLEGWLHTGDIGVMNEAGYLKITDRKKDIVLVGGFNVSPTEVESILLGCDAIDQVALIGAPDDRLGEVGAAYVVLRPGATVTADEIKLWASAHMANFKVPRYVAIVESLPRNASGKVLKHELRTSSDIRIDMEGT